MWLIGIDEAGYGPNLGPFVMSAVACRLDEEGPVPDLWLRLADVVRKGGRETKRCADKLLIDDSKIVYSGAHGLARLERGVLGPLANSTPLACLADLVSWVAPDDRDELAAEFWYAGTSPVPLHSHPDLPAWCQRFAGACAATNLGSWSAASVVVCPARFNALTEAAGSKAAVPAYALARLLQGALAHLGGEEPLVLFIDKQGGRNSYTAQVQHGLVRGVVLPLEEGAERSTYRVAGLGQEVHLTFEPRADQRHLTVALASMVSKYLRERCMEEFNAFWQRHVPGLAPTAGYPVDAARFLEAVRPTVSQLGIPLERLWRSR